MWIPVCIITACLPPLVLTIDTIHPRSPSVQIHTTSFALTFWVAPQCERHNDMIYMYSRSAFDFRFSEAPFEWTSDNLESLRLCRNRAYHKVNSKRRQHLPASISSYLLKEWQAMRPDAPKMDGKQLLAAYNENFEQVGGKYPNASINAKGGVTQPSSYAMWISRPAQVPYLARN